VEQKRVLESDLDITALDQIDKLWDVAVRVLQVLEQRREEQPEATGEQIKEKNMQTQPELSVGGRMTSSRPLVVTI
jgi:hypothetical protein